MGEIVLIPGGKEEFVEWINASSKTNHWMHNYDDYECYRNMLGDKNMRFMAAKTKSGEYIGSCICFVFPEYAFVGAYYVRPEFRGQGIGSRLFNLVVNGDVRKKNVGLHAAPAMAHVYQQKLGFKVKLPWLAYKLVVTNIQFNKLQWWLLYSLPYPPSWVRRKLYNALERTPRRVKMQNETLHLRYFSSSGLANNFIVKDIKEVSLEQLVEYDAKVAKTHRKPFVQSWIYDRRDAASKVALNSNNEIIGYGSGHMFSIWESVVFCPIYCDNDVIFGTIFCALANHFKEQIQRKNMIDLRVPTKKLQAAQAVLRGIADSKTVEADTPLFTNCIPEHNIHKIYSVSDLNMFI